jgi:hypothetical protein
MIGDSIMSNQFQAQAELQAQLEAQLQAQLQGQGQGQHQGQGQGQGQAQGQGQGQAQGQGQWQSAALYSDSSNWNANGNLNLNGNANLNANGNLNGNANVNYNHNSNTVEVKVDVDVDVDATPQNDNDAIDIDYLAIYDLDGQLFINPDNVNQNASGDGNDVAFNVDQINNLVDNDGAYATVSNYALVGYGVAGTAGDGADEAEGTGIAFSMKAEATGGESSIDGVESTVGDAREVSDLADASADAAASNSAFNQNIVMGANLQFNQIDLQIAGETIDGLS